MNLIEYFLAFSVWNSSKSRTIQRRSL